MPSEPELHRNQMCQRWLAESLVANLGYVKAVKVCRNMCWYGTLNVLVAEEDRHFTPSSPRGPGYTKAA